MNCKNGKFQTTSCVIVIDVKDKINKIVLLIVTFTCVCILQK